MFCQKTDGGGDTARSTASTSSCRSIPSSGSGVAGRQQRPLSGSKKTAVTAGSVSGRSSSSASSARASRYTHTHTHTRLTALFPGLPGEPVPESKTDLDFTEARDSEWQ